MCWRINKGHATGRVLLMTYVLSDLSVDRGGKRVLAELSLPFERGCVTGLIGPNGAGKSTLLSVLAGQMAETSGQIELDGSKVCSRDILGLARARAVMAQQIPNDIHLSVEQVVSLGLYAFGDLAAQDQKQLVAQAADMVGISSWLARSMAMHSIGQQQRVHFARALVQLLAIEQLQQVAWLLLDEPTASQDPLHQQQLLACCKTLVTRHTVGVVVALHDLTLAAQWCERLVVLREGRLVAHGLTSEILTEATVQRAFGDQLGVYVTQEPAPGVVIYKKTNDN
jgi:iron complex transport system ATP-binding protein